jgi:hypothetical protein
MFFCEANILHYLLFKGFFIILVRNQRGLFVVSRGLLSILVGIGPVGGSTDDTLASSGTLGDELVVAGLLLGLNLLLGLLLRLGLLLFSSRAHQEQINHNVPRFAAGDGATEAQDFTGQEPEGQSNRETGLVVARNGNVDVTERGVGVAEANDGDVDVRSFNDGLVVLQGISNDQQAGLGELLLDLVSEGTRGEATSVVLSTGVLRELQDGALSEGLTGTLNGNDGNVVGVLDGDDGTGSQDDLFPGLANVNNVGT